MVNKGFTHNELRQMLAGHAVVGWEGSCGEAIYQRILELSRFKHVYGRHLPLSAFIENLQPPEGVDDTATVEVIVFRSKDRIWQASAIFTTVPDDKQHLLKAMLTVLKPLQIELVPLSPQHIRGGYLMSSDFKRRMKQAIFVPTEVPYRKLPPVPDTGDWKNLNRGRRRPYRIV